MRALSSAAGSFDLAYFQQAAWLIAQGESPFVTTRGIHLLGDHASVAFYPMAWVAGRLPVATTLLAMQSYGMAAAAFPIWGLSRRHAGLGRPASGLVLLLLALHPALHNAALFDFHPEFLAVPALLGAVYHAESGRWWGFGASLPVAAAVGWFVPATRVIQPHFAAEVIQAEFLSAYGDGIGEISGTFATERLRVAGDLVTARNGSFALAMLLPVGLLPLLAPRCLLPGVPLAALYLLSSREGAHDIQHYVVVPLVFVMAALPFGLARVQGLIAGWNRRTAGPPYASRAPRRS